MSENEQAQVRWDALTEAWQAVDRAITPLGYGGGATNSPWNKGYEQAKNEALNAILALRKQAHEDWHAQAADSSQAGEPRD